MTMSCTWIFSPSSQALLKRCLDAAAPYDSANKWTKMFGPKNNELVDGNNTINDLSDSPDKQHESSPDTREDKPASCNFEDIIDNDTVLTRFDIFQEESLKNPLLLTRLALNLPVNTIEGLIQLIFDGTDKNAKFISYFLEYFLPVFIRRDNSRLCTDVLLKTERLYPEYFRKLLKIIIKDAKVQNNVLNDFIISLDEEKVTDFLNICLYIELTSEEFVHNLFTIYTAYKTCRKSGNIQNYIFSCLKTYNNVCTNDKNYGRLMLTYLQSLNSSECKANSTILGDLLENHRSPFKRPCMTILKEINDK